MNYTVRLTIYIVVASLLGLFFLFLFFYGPIKRLLYEKDTVRMYHKKIYRVALDNDFYLINRWSMEMADDGDGVHIDHILFGDKFIYVLKDRYYHGAISAKIDDQSWIYFLSKRKKRYIDNPMLLNKVRIDRLALASGLERSYFVSIVVVNDDCLLTRFKNTSKDSFLVPLSKLGRFIEAKEKSEDVQQFTPDELAIAVRELAELNQNEPK